MAILTRTPRSSAPVDVTSSSSRRSAGIETPPLSSRERALNRQLAANRRKFAFLLELTERHRRGGRYGKAAAYAQMAADFAVHNHTGLLASQRLEESLLAIGSSAGPSSDSGGGEWTWPATPMRTDRPPARVLHVISDARSAGGHTRLLWRWIQNDALRSHAVAFTQQGAWQVPSTLTEAVETREGGLFFLDRDGSDLTLRGQRLRRLASDADFVVLHVTPFDVVPILAFADPADLPPIAFMNHADHAFWVGRSVGNLFLHFREVGREHSIARRGLDERLTALLPLPIEFGRRRLPRREAKARLGCPSGSTVLVSAAWGYKYLPLGGVDFGQVHADFLRKTPGTILFVVGPDRDARWVRHEETSAGRLRVIPASENLSLYYEAMDIYVGSFPFSALTSTLEAALYSVPVATFDPSASKVLGLDDPSLREHIHRTVASYLTHLQRLVADPGLRERVGAELAGSVALDHTGEGWLRSMESAYERGLSLRGARPGILPREPSDSSDAFDRLLAHVNSTSGRAKGLQGSVVSHWRLLPLRSRVRAFLAEVAVREPLRACGVLCEFLGGVAGRILAGRRGRRHP